MSNYATYDPADYTVDDLMRAAHGDTRVMAPSLAVEMLRVKIGVDTESTMARLAEDESADPRARRTATLALADYPTQPCCASLPPRSTDGSPTLPGGRCPVRADPAAHTGLRRLAQCNHSCLKPHESVSLPLAASHSCAAVCRNWWACSL